MQIDKPFRRKYENSYTHENSVVDGTVPDFVFDVSSRHTSPKQKWRPPLPYSRQVDEGAHVANITTHYKFVDSDGYYAMGDFTGYDNCSGYWYSSIPAFPVSLRTRCEIGARTKLKNESLNISTNLGERAQTAGLVVSTCKRLHDGIMAARRGNIAGVADALGVSRRKIRKGSPFDLWLEMQYGWKPMLGDVHSAVSLLSDKENGDEPPVTTVKSGARDNDVTYNTIIASAASDGFCKFYLKKRHEIERKCMVRLDFVPGNNMLSTASQLGLTNPLELAWELLPFSFVVDWFAPVGKYFSQLDATLGWDFRSGSLSTVTRMKSRVEEVVCIPTYPNTVAYGYGNGSSYQVAMSREIYTEPPCPLPWLSLKKDSSGDHVANGISLLASAFTKKVKG